MGYLVNCLALLNTQTASEVRESAATLIPLALCLRISALWTRQPKSWDHRGSLEIGICKGCYGEVKKLFSGKGYFSETYLKAISHCPYRVRISDIPSRFGHLPEVGTPLSCSGVYALSATVGGTWQRFRESFERVELARVKPRFQVLYPKTYSKTKNHSQYS